METIHEEPAGATSTQAGEGEGGPTPGPTLTPQLVVPPPPALPIPSNYWCLRDARCVRPAGHSGRCSVVHASEEAKQAKLLRNVVAHFAKNETPAGDSDEEAEEEEEEAGPAPPTARVPAARAGGTDSGPALTALPPTSVLQDMQQQLNNLNVQLGVGCSCRSQPLRGRQHERGRGRHPLLRLRRSGSSQPCQQRQAQAAAASSLTHAGSCWAV